MKYILTPEQVSMIENKLNFSPQIDSENTKIDLIREQLEYALEVFKTEQKEGFNSTTYKYITDNKESIIAAMEVTPEFRKLIKSLNYALDAMYEDCLETLVKIAEKEEMK